VRAIPAYAADYWDPAFLKSGHLSDRDMDKNAGQRLERKDIGDLRPTYKTICGACSFPEKSDGVLQFHMESAEGESKITLSFLLAKGRRSDGTACGTVRSQLGVQI
jgi:hypothetical protein